MTALRLLEALHGYLAVLAVASLIHPAITLRRGKPLVFRSKASIVSATALALAAFFTGLSVYAPYRNTVRRPLFRDNVDVGLLFETKEHLAFVVLAFSVGGALIAFLAPKHSTELRKLAAQFYLGAALVGLFVAASGIFIAAVRSFGSAP